MSNIEKMLDAVIGREGGYVNDPRDAGGETIWGITVGTARANGYQTAMRSMTRDQAKDIYRKQYWLRPGFDRIEAIFPRVADEMFDTGINMGPAKAGEFLQRALNVLTGAILTVDGRVGPATLKALDSYRAARGRQDGEEVLVRVLDGLQVARYVELVERRAQNGAFIFGWIRARIENA